MQDTFRLLNYNGLVDHRVNRVRRDAISSCVVADHGLPGVPLVSRTDKPPVERPCAPGVDGCVAQDCGDNMHCF